MRKFFISILLLNLFVSFVLSNTKLISPSSIFIDTIGTIYAISGRDIYKYTNEGKFIHVINKKVGDISFVEDHFSVMRYINDKKSFGTRITPHDINIYAKYLRTTPTLESIIEKIIYPEQITIGPDGNIYAIGQDIFRKNYKIGIIDPNDGRTIFVFGQSGREEADLLWPKGIVVDDESNIYIPNHVFSKEGRKLYAVKKYDNQGNFITSWGTWGGGAGEFKDPWAIAIDDKNEYVYVTDAFYPSWMRGTGEQHPQEKVLKFTKDGKFIKSWGGNRITGIAIYPPTLLVEPDFSDPVGIAVDSHGYVYVLEDDRARVSKYDGEGRLLMRWGNPGESSGEFRNPQAIAIDKDDNIYIADTDNNRVQKFDSNGKFLMEIK